MRKIYYAIINDIMINKQYNTKTQQYNVLYCNNNHR